MTQNSVASSSRDVQLIVSPRAAERIEAARRWLGAVASGSTEVLVVAATPYAAADLIRELTCARGALFGVHRMTLARLAGLIAAEKMAMNSLAPADGLAPVAITTRAIAAVVGEGSFAYFGPLVGRPGLPAALANTIRELRMAEIDPSTLAERGEREAALAALLTRYDAELRAAGLADYPAILRIAAETIATRLPTRFVGWPTLLLDLPVTAAAESRLLRALIASAPAALATAPAGDTLTISRFEELLGVQAFTAITTSDETSLARMQNHLFVEMPPPAAGLDASVSVISAAGEMQECIELARLIQAEARAGTRFDRIAIALHAPAYYTSSLREALDRASIPAFFARGTARPEPGGRALLTLLACAAEGLSARRFAEYLSLAQTRDSTPSGDDLEQILAVVNAGELGAAPLKDDIEAYQMSTEDVALAEAASTPAPDHAARAPWRWERLLVDAAVIGGSDRWRRRLDGLAAELKLRRDNLDDGDEARAAALDRELADLADLRATAMPIIDALAALPTAATWNVWLDHLRALAAIAIRDCESVLTALAELEPTGPVGPVDLEEVRMVLNTRLGRLEQRPMGDRYGRVFIATPDGMRGMKFDVVFVTGLAERLFPAKLMEDPILPDRSRGGLGASMATQATRASAERLALRIAAGASSRRVVFSYPRVDLGQGRPRVPSFYALEVLRSAEGRLPGFDELSRRAAGEQIPRAGWPVPNEPELAIDDAEFDLAVLERLLDRDPEETTGAAAYLLGANPHLARALRWRARRWLRRWTVADGLVDPAEGGRAALARHRLDARSYSPTALQNFAACPYRFFLQAIHRLRPREDAIALEVLDPLTRGAMFHEIQFAVLTELRNAALLPLTMDNLAAAMAIADRALERIGADYHDRLAPAIETVWRDAVASLAADLREWMRRAARESTRWTPEHFELAFGLADRAQCDPASRLEPVALEGGLLLRGSIDLVESDGTRLRITDHKTGRVRAAKSVVVNGGRILQPVLYALAAERLLERKIAAGRLYYCTSAGGYEERVVPLDENARRAAAEVIAIIRGALEEAFFPAAPAPGECRFCDYRMVCGPYEEQRVARKPPARLKPLSRLRALP
jgi:ATP-dependent helicase/nuclease subunit B